MSGKIGSTFVRYRAGNRTFKSKAPAIRYAEKKGISRVKKTTYQNEFKGSGKSKVYGGNKKRSTSGILGRLGL